MRADRNLVIGSFCVGGSAVFVADELLPIVAEIDPESGEARRVFSWKVDGVDSEEPTATALAFRDGSLWVSAPSAGGMVRIDLEMGESVVLPLDFAPGPISTLGNDLLVVAYRDWGPSSEGAATAASEHPIVWEGPGPDAPFDLSEIDMSFDVARPIWRIGDHGVERIDPGGDVTSVVSLDRETIFATVRRTDHALMLTSNGFGSASCSYPASVVRFDSNLRAEVVAELQDGGRLFSTGSEVWCVDHGARGPRRPELLRVHPPGDPSGFSIAGITPAALAGAEALVVENTTSLTDSDSAAPGSILRVFGLPDGSDIDTIELPTRVDQYDEREPVADGSTIWLVAESGDALVRVNVPGRAAELLPVVVPTAAHRPSPVPPPNIDLPDHNTRSLQTIRDELLGGWHGDDGTQHPFIRGVEFESIELDEADFPDASITATFRSVGHPGVLFGIRWYLYDELGRTEDTEYWGFHLMEVVESGHLPAADDYRPDEQGVIWIR